MRDRFGRANMERRRSRAEPNTHHAPDELAISSEPDMTSLAQSGGRPERPASVLSGKTTATRRSRFRGRSQRSMSQPKDPRSGSYEPPPFFQAYSQARKDGILEVPSMSVEALYRAKCKIPVGNGAHSESVGGTQASMEAKRGSALKRAQRDSYAGSNLPRKIFVLATAGYLLQYAEKGLTDRLPEKVLHLSRESAAFPCDLIPGRHYVLQVSQAVNREGVAVEATSSGSLLFRLGIKSAAAKRAAPNLILVLPNAAEMESWLSALRRDIEAVGGKKIKHHTAQHHTFKVGVQERDDSGSIQVSKQYRIDPRAANSNDIPEMPKFGSPPKPSVLPDVVTDEPDRSTMDEIELEAISLNHNAGPESDETQRTFYDDRPPSPSNTAEELAPSSTSDRAKSDEIASLPETCSDKTPIEHPDASSMGKESLPDRPPETRSSAFVHDLSKLNDTSQVRMPELDVFSHTPSRKPPPPPLVFSPYSHLNKRPIIEESPIIPNYPSLSPVVAVKLSHAYAERDYQISMAGAWPIRHRHDSKLDSPPTPTKIVVRNAARRGLPAAIALKGLGSLTVTEPPVHASISSVQESDGSSKAALSSMSLQAISTGDSFSDGNVKRLPQPNNKDEFEAVELRHVSEDGSLSSKAGPADRSRSPSPPIYTHTKAPSTAQNAGFSLFPQPVTTTAISSNTTPRETPIANLSQARSQQVRTYEPSRRLSSSQVGTEQPHYLLSTSTTVYPPTAPVPIGSARRSRSAGNVADLANHQHPSKTNTTNASRLHMPTASEEVDLAKPLPQCPPTSLAKRAPSRNSIRKSFRGLDHLPDIDFGIPIALLGPPAPPPQAPLPAPPVNSKPTSPMLMHQAVGGMTSVAGLGISV